MTHAQMVADLSPYFEGRREIAFAFLFGSHARGTATRLSDVDVAAYFYPLTETFDYQSNVEYPTEHEVWADAERIVRTDVELLVLNRASPNIATSALRGIPLSIKDWGLYADLGRQLPRDRRVARRRQRVRSSPGSWKHRA
ncbi:MAG TPA: nucleotidyltransferase domain-containing protein, partial [Spirochaetia bacterium]|nr:nucleotidyltransferase domain-containing protein [Spirochaetia bacterium]